MPSQIISSNIKAIHVHPIKLGKQRKSQETSNQPQHYHVDLSLPVSQVKSFPRMIFYGFPKIASTSADQK